MKKSQFQKSCILSKVPWLGRWEQGFEPSLCISITLSQFPDSILSEVEEESGPSIQYFRTQGFLFSLVGPLPITT